METTTSTATETQHSERYDDGWTRLQQIDSEAGEQVIDGLKDISPDLGQYIIEYAFGDVYGRGKLALKTTELAVVGALAALGTAKSQLKVHIHGALNTGGSRSEVLEAIIQSAVYAGFPAALNAMPVAKEVFAERDESGKPDSSSAVPAPLHGRLPDESRYERGLRVLQSLKPEQEQILKDSLGRVAPDLITYMIEFGYGDILSRPGLSLPDRQLVTIAILTALSTAPNQLQFHIEGAARVGCTQEQITEVILAMTVYAGFPAAINGMMAVKAVLVPTKQH